MLLILNAESQNFEELSDKVIDKYQSVSKAVSIVEIQEFATNFKEMYEKFYPAFLKTQYQHGMYLALVNVTPSNVTDFHKEYRDENHKVFWENDTIQSTYFASTVFEALVTNLRKLTTDLSWDKSSSIGDTPPRAISMKRITKDIEEFHKKIGVNNGEFVQFEKDLNNLIENIENGQDLERLWSYADKYNIHLEDQYSLDDEQLFPLTTLRTAIDNIMGFINVIVEFYEYDEAAHIVDVGRTKTQSWIASFASYKVNSLRIMREYIDSLASFCNNANYINLDPAEASQKICDEEIFVEGTYNEELRIRIGLAIQKSIERLREI
ncbi:MAG: hypothetical protein OXG97_08170 [Candidatus Poribacteria bacterium]|nr:hypothetical protein [Candidatus Poribacteria bacterium]